MAPKRAGGRGAGRPAKKAKTEVREKDPMKEAVKSLVAAFEDEDQVGLSSVPELTKEMLGSVIPFSLGAGAAEDERHSYQVGIAGAIGEVLQEVVKVWEGKVVEAQSAITAAEALRTEKAGNADTAESTLASRTAGTDAAQEKLSNAKKTLVDATANLGTCRDQVDTFDIQLTRKETELERVKAVLADHFGVLKAGVEWANEKEQAAGEKKHLGSIASMLKQLKADTSLMSALSSALVRKPAERGQFDTMAIEQLETILTTKVNEHESHINNAESLKAEKTAAVTQAETTLANSETAKTQSEEELEAAKKAQKEAGTALKDAKTYLNKQDSAVEETKENATSAAESSEEAKKNLGAFEFLLSRPSKAPEPEPMVVEEEPPAEEPAAAEPVAAEPAE